MTAADITLRGSVRRVLQPGPPLWVAFALVHQGTEILDQRAALAHSHPEAMLWAHKLLSDLERERMDKVHASRASRRPRPLHELPTRLGVCDCPECDDARAFVEATA